jgi:YHS domain-containing protein
MKSRRNFLIGSGVVLIAGLSFGFTPAMAVSPEIFADAKTGVAINGYDPVAYFTQNMPVEGSEQFNYSWKGAKWLFSSEENKNLFAAEPQKYAPQYGGYCAYAVSRGSIAPTDPQAFSIVDDKLYLNFSLSVRKRWSKDIAGNIAKADKNWPDVLK